MKNIQEGSNNPAVSAGFSASKSLGAELYKAALVGKPLAAVIDAWPDLPAYVQRTFWDMAKAESRRRRRAGSVHAPAARSRRRIG